MYGDVYGWRLQFLMNVRAGGVVDALVENFLVFELYHTHTRVRSLVVPGQLDEFALPIYTYRHYPFFFVNFWS